MVVTPFLCWCPACSGRRSSDAPPPPPYPRPARLRGRACYEAAGAASAAEGVLLTRAADEDRHPARRPRAGPRPAARERADCHPRPWRRRRRSADAVRLGDARVDDPAGIAEVHRVCAAHKKDGRSSHVRTPFGASGLVGLLTGGEQAARPRDRLREVPRPPKWVGPECRYAYGCRPVRAPPPAAGVPRDATPAEEGRGGVGTVPVPEAAGRGTGGCGGSARP
ncbi:hypothetical protein SSBG_05593 [Streptomyces sp. SPB074]|nr:hypothetical protein SSBG_05593 [Streptomyces sp. SPB074]